MGVNGISGGGNLTQVLATLRRTLLQERVAVQLVEQALEAEKAANASGGTRGKVLDVEI